MNSVRHNLKNLRLKKEMTQDELAERLHVVRQTVSSWETGKTEPGIDTLMEIAEALSVDITELLYGPRPQTAFEAGRPGGNGRRGSPRGLSVRPYGRPLLTGHAAPVVRSKNRHRMGLGRRGPLALLGPYQRHPAPAMLFPLPCRGPQHCGRIPGSPHFSNVAAAGTVDHRSGHNGHPSLFPASASRARFRFRQLWPVYAALLFLSPPPRRLPLPGAAVRPGAEPVSSAYSAPLSAAGRNMTKFSMRTPRRTISCRRTTR